MESEKLTTKSREELIIMRLRFLAGISTTKAPHSFSYTGNPPLATGPRYATSPTPWPIRSATAGTSSEPLPDNLCNYRDKRIHLKRDGPGAELRVIEA